MNSIEGAAQFISNGQTSDLAKAQIINEGFALNMEALEQAGLRRSMGFDFSVKIDPSVHHILVKSNEKPFVSTRALLFEGDISPTGMVTNQETIDRLVQACLRLKEKFDKYTLEDNNVDESDTIDA